jgi:hypothetical protein
MKYIYILISFLIISSCKKDTNQPSAKNFGIGQKFANGIIWSFESIDDISRPTNMPNYNLLIIGLNDYTDLTFYEARQKVISLRDEFGEWNYQNLNFFQYSPSLEDSIIKNGGKGVEKNARYWVNGISDRKNGLFYILNNTYNVQSTSTPNLSEKYRVRPTRSFTFYNTPIKSYKIGDTYKRNSRVFSVDSVNRKIKVYQSTSEYTTWTEAQDLVKIRIYDGEYGYRLPTIDEVKLIQSNNITLNISCWTSDLDPNDSNKAFSYNSNGSFNGVPTKLLSWNKISENGSFAQQIFGVKEVSY